MDYNLFVCHSMAIERPAKSAAFEECTYKAFRTAFNIQYDGECIPLQLGFHFFKMNGSAYWNAYERLLSGSVPERRCRLRQLCKEAMPMIEARCKEQSEE